MTFSYDDWKKKQKKGSATPKTGSFEEWKKNRGPSEVDTFEGGMLTYGNFAAKRRAAELDAQPPKSEKARKLTRTVSREDIHLREASKRVKLTRTVSQVTHLRTRKDNAKKHVKLTQTVSQVTHWPAQG